STTAPSADARGASAPGGTSAWSMPGASLSTVYGTVRYRWDTKSQGGEYPVGSNTRCPEAVRRAGSQKTASTASSTTSRTSVTDTLTRAVSPSADTFAPPTAAVSGSASTASTRRPALANAIASAPIPHPRSATIAAPAAVPAPAAPAAPAATRASTCTPAFLTCIDVGLSTGV